MVRLDFSLISNRLVSQNLTETVTRVPQTSDRALERWQDLTEATVWKLGPRERFSIASPESLLSHTLPPHLPARLPVLGMMTMKRPLVASWRMTGRWWQRAWVSGTR